MQTVHTEGPWRFSADAASVASLHANSGSAQFPAQRTDDRAGLPSGWWLVPSITLGAGFWVWSISALLT
jgi:hypothetical protein